MDGPQGDSMSERHRRAPGKQSSASPLDAAATRNGVSSANPPCGACKFLRRKCLSGCIFAPHFGSDQGAARFAAVHKVFGASNVSKLLLHIPANRRHDAVLTICYEAQARLSDPVYGCVSTIVALQQQVTSLHTELSFLQTQLINSRFVMSNALQTSPQLQQQQEHLQHQQMAASLLQPAYSKASSGSENLMSMHSFSTQFAETAPSSSFDHVYSHVSSRTLEDQEEEEEESHDPVLAFANHIFHS